MSDHDDVVATDYGMLQVTEDTTDGNPILHHLSVYRTRARMVSESRVERLARELQAAESFSDWGSLSETDQELWRHMARLKLC
jgi:hypothetical protein